MADLNQEEREKLVHEVDGIPELDNPTPRWFAWLFYSTILFAFLYLAYWGGYQKQFNHLQGKGDARAFSETRLALMQAEAAGKDTTNWDAVTGKAISQYANDPKVIARGKGLFAQKCSACHGADAKGSVGPNLTDATWIYGGKVEDIEKTVSTGTAKGMLPFKAEGQKNIVALVAYVHSLGGGQ